MNDRHEAHHQYVVVFRARSAAIFPPGLYLRVNALQPFGRSVITIRTRYIDKGLESPLPGSLWIEAQGPADSLENAVNSIGGSVGSLLAVIAFAANTAIGDIEPELVFDNTPGLGKRDFLQSMLPEEESILSRGYKVPRDATSSLIQALEKYKISHNGNDRLIRSIAQYRLSLNHWKWGSETMSIAHLFMGIDALTPVIVKTQLEVSGLSENEFARKMGIDPMKLGKCERLSVLINAAVRRNILFQGDDECHQYAKKASDGFEHGYMDFDEIRKHARTVRDKTAVFLRTAILDLLEIEPEHREALLSPPYDEPLGKWPVVKYVKGELVGESDELVDEESDYPLIKWHSAIKSARMGETGEYDLILEEGIFPRLAKGIEFRLKSIEVWGR